MRVIFFKRIRIKFNRNGGDPLTIRFISRKSLLSTQLFNVDEVQIELPNKKLHRYQRVDHADSVTILPVDEKGQIWFVIQYRVGANSDLLELPAGVIEKDETPLVCAQREVQEEIGMAARNIQLLGSFYLAPGYCNEVNHAFIARELFSSPLAKDEDEFLNITILPVEQAYQMAQAGIIQDAKSLAALFLASPILQK
jgi:ADP-ribose pyrophosphatase